MRVPIERVEVQPVTNYGAARENLEAVLDGNLPLFVLLMAGLTTDDVVENFDGVFRQRRYRLPETDLNLFQGPSRQRVDKSTGRPADIKVLRRTERLHIDGRPNLTKPPTTAINMHLTTQGKAKGEFLEVSEAFAHSGLFALPAGTDELLSSGFVDTDVLDPTMFAVEAGVGNLIVFRTVGQYPLAHRFAGLEIPRSSYIIHAFSRELLAA